ncbi:MAG: helicase-related protein [Nitrospinota bacterium]|nr:helicase-related protein [Nitrospinota bacterium]
MSVNPLLEVLSKTKEVRRFNDSLARNISASLVLTCSVVRSYFIGSIALNNKLVVVSDDSFALYHESVGVASIQSQYLPTFQSADIFPETFNLSKSKYVQAMAATLAGDLPNVIYTEGGLNEPVPKSIMTKKVISLHVRVDDRLLIADTIKTLNKYGYDENIQAKNIGEYARRGGIVDVFPTNTKNPIRIEFNDDVVASIRYYNPTSQVSVETTNNIIIPTLIKNISDVLSITYKDKLMELGYSTIKVGMTNNSWQIDFAGRNNNYETETIQIKDISLKTDEYITKNKQDITAIYVVGNNSKPKDYYPNNSIYINGHINGSVLIYNSGLAIIKNDTIKKVNEYNKKRSEEYFYSYNWGDHITHIDYGVGIYRGLVKKHNKDYLKLEYAKNSTIHLLAQRIDMIAPLVGTKKPKINNLGDKSWTTRKEKTKKNIQDIIADMVSINKNRLLRREIHYKQEDYLEKSIGESFPYTETGDQAAAINDIYKDMVSPGLMDRLIIGDVGFGKTEVALRAAAKAAFSGVLVMVVVPTTILANQHYILFKNRLENFGVTVEMLSRFITHNKQKKIINNIRNKQVDIVVGTHKLLSDTIPKNRLGLLIIDDEHRFGVVHKNKLLKLKKSVDVLTLTATPIPRTLQQSLLGLKSVSLINTPPVKRVPIKTQVVYQNWAFIKKVIEVELNRGGQVYFLHNRIESIRFYEKIIVDLLPGATIASAHGGMNSGDLEKIILSFFKGSIQVLISTTIIEAGLDVPNANTIIINSAQMYGLSQLYQIRGRVGRGERQGFCYLVIPKEESLTGRSIERLKTIQENTDLGSGYRIAIKDLELRGAGNVFGYEQSGHISSIGYHLYCKMFNDELNKSRGTEKNIRVPKIQYFGKASFEDSYMPLSQDRLYYYQRLSAAKNKQDIGAVQKEVTDRCGKPSPGTINLYKITEIRTAYTQTLVKNILIEKDRVVLTLMGADPKIANEMSVGNLMNALETAGTKYMFKQLKKDDLGLEMFCDAENEPLTMLMRKAELFYYDNNNT